MAKYENAEKISKLLEEDGLSGVMKRLSSTERNLSEILKNLSVLEAEKAERDRILAEEAARAEAARLAEEAKKAQQEKEEAQAPAEELVQEKPKKRTAKKK